MAEYRGLRAGFTGTQNGMTVKQYGTFAKLINRLKPTEFHHGDCIGSDETATFMVWRFRCTENTIIVGHPPDKNNKRAFSFADVWMEPKPYLERNTDIVSDTDYLIATPGGFEEELRSGTWSTIRRARKQNKRQFIIYPDGKVTIWENGHEETYSLD